MVIPPPGESFWDRVGDFFNDQSSAISQLFEGHGKAFVDDTIDSGASIERAFKIGDIGADWGWISFDAGAHGDDNTASFGFFGAEFELDHNISTNTLHHSFGAHIGFGLKSGLSIGAITSTTPQASALATGRSA